MNTFFIISLGVAMLAVLIVMLMGVISMTKGGEFNKKYGNKLMQARVYLQGVAMFCFAMAVFTSQS